VGAFIDHDLAALHSELDFGARSDSELVTDVLGNRDAASFSNSHTWKYDIVCP
jgi:hypothetical protein